MIDRREFLKTGAALTATAAIPGFARAGAIFAPDPGDWRSYDIVDSHRARWGCRNGPRVGAVAWLRL